MTPAFGLHLPVRTSNPFVTLAALRRIALGLLVLSLGTVMGHAQWVQVNNGLNDLTINALATIDTAVFAGTAKGLYRSTDAGESWAHIDPDTSAVRRIATDGKRLLIQSDSSLVYSSDRGSSWIRVKATAWWANDNTISTIAVRDTLVMVGTYGSTTGGAVLVFRSSDFGASWTAQSTPDPFFHDRGGVTRICSADSLVYLAMRDEESTGDIYRSMDNGVNWTALPRFPLVNDRWVGISDLAVVGSSLYTTVYYYGGGTSVRKSTDGGVSWTTAESHGPFGTFENLTSNGRSILVRTGDIILRSQDNGTTWKNISGSLAGQSVRCLAMSEREAYAGVTGIGVFRHDLAGGLGVRVIDPGGERGIPTEFSLAQNYPNPFNPTTTISYGVPSRTQVTLSVFNTLGQLVRVLVDGEQVAGYHEVTFDAFALASGVYLCRMQAGAFTETRKLVLAR